MRTLFFTLLLSLLPTFVNAQFVGSKDDYHWDPRFQNIGIDGGVGAMAIDGEEIFIAGAFGSVEGRRTGTLARFDGRKWEGLGNYTRWIYDLVLTPDYLYLVDDEHVEHTIFHGLRRWDRRTNQWSFHNFNVVPHFATVRLAYIGPHEVCAFGDFDRIGSVNAAGIAIWNDSTNTWSALGANTSATKYVNIRTVKTAADKLYVGGEFWSMGGVPALRVACFDRTMNAWKNLGEGFGDTTGRRAWVSSILADGDTVYVSGSDEFGPAGGSIKRWVVSSEKWLTVGSGLPAPAHTMIRSGNSVFAAGSHVWGPSYFAEWDGTSWEFLDDASYVSLLINQGGVLFGCGTFRKPDALDPDEAVHLARWLPSEKEWLPLHPQEHQKPFSLLFDMSAVGKDIFVQGYREDRLSDVVDYIADGLHYWNGSKWTTIDTTKAEHVEFMPIGTDGTHLYAMRGNFLSRLMRYTPSRDTWDTLSTPIPGLFRQLAVTGSKVFLAGEFDSIHSVVSKNLIAFDTATRSWEAIATPLNGVEEFEHFPIRTDESYLYTILASPSSRSASTSQLLRYNINAKTWDTLRSELLTAATNFIIDSTSVIAIVADSRGRLERMSKATMEWSTVDAKLYDIRSLAASSGKLYVGGSFDSVNSVAAKNIAVFDGSIWKPLGSGTDGSVRSLLAIGHDVYLGGEFQTAGVYSSYHFAHWSNQERLSAKPTVSSSDPVLQSINPNPARDQVHVTFSLLRASEVRLELYDALGRKCITRASEQFNAGEHSVELSLRTPTFVPTAGVYSVVLRTGEASRSLQCVLLK